jgi:3-hydroxyacyl-CoA dehydrogenase/enoyl-CoA hydratase/3-hydroxybutyryl-CoA epimerase
MTEAAVAGRGGVPTFEILESGAALIRLGGADERVVTLTVERIAALRAILERFAAAPPKGVIIAGSGPDMFTAGADISIIASVTDPAVGEKLAREGQRVFDLIEQLSCPTVAAISGPCVGGGCELALACAVRICTDTKSTTIGLPEVKLGILPGFGGTQRLPRLIGLPRALDIILSGKTLKAQQALRYGLVNEIVSPHTLLSRAEGIALGSTVARRPRLDIKTRLLTFTAAGRALVRRQATATIRKESKGFYPAPPAALEAALYGLAQGVRSGLDFEARELGRLVVTPESKSLVNLFFLTEQAKSLGKAGRKSVETVNAVVVGAGAMGAGIAATLARSESSVILKDTSEASLKHGLEQIRAGLAKSRSMTEQERSFILNRIETTTRDSANSANANFAIEAIFEDLSLKKKVLSDLAKSVSPDAVIATNTSSLSVTEIGSALPSPERVVGMHFFNPVERMPLVEIIRGQQTNDKTTLVVAALATKLGKFPIIVNDVPGFLVNRILSPYLTEAACLVSDGYAVEDIDRAATAFGMPMGPIRLLDEIGLDVASHVADIMFAGYGARMSGPGYAKKLVAAGRKGKKNGAGFYDFQENTATPCPDLRKILGIEKPSQRAADPAVIVDRLMLSLVNEAVRCLDEGVAGAPGADAANQIDLGSVMGFGFPPFRGGLLYYADKIGAQAIALKLEELHTRLGERFSPAPGIAKRAELGKSFHTAI